MPWNRQEEKQFEKKKIRLTKVHGTPGWDWEIPMWWTFIYHFRFMFALSVDISRRFINYYYNSDFWCLVFFFFANSHAFQFDHVHTKKRILFSQNTIIGLSYVILCATLIKPNEMKWEVIIMNFFPSKMLLFLCFEISRLEFTLNWFTC